MTRAKGKRQSRASNWREREWIEASEHPSYWRQDDEWDALTLRLIDWTDDKIKESAK